MAILLSPIGNSVHYVDSDGKPLSGAQLFIYTAGTSAKVSSFKDNLGTANNTNPIILKGDGSAPYPIWLNSNGGYKFVLAPKSDIDPPTSAIWSIDDVPVNDTTVSADQWIPGPAPTFISTNSFSLVGDQTSNFHIGRRVKIAQSGATVYGTITASVFAVVTTITVALDSGVIDSGINTVWMSILTNENYAVPFGAKYTAIGDMLYASAPKLATILPAGNDGTLLSSTFGKVPAWWAPSGYKYGLGLSNDVSSPTSNINIATGEITDTSASYIMKLTAPLIKQIDNPWVAGTNAGGRFTASLLNDTWYHVFLIKKDSDGTLDAGFDTSITAANIPAGYTAYARLGSVLTTSNVLAPILGFQQFKDTFLWNAPTLDHDALITSTRVLIPLQAPLDINTKCSFNAYTTNSSYAVYFSNPDVDDLIGSTTVAPLSSFSNTTSPGGDLLEIITDTSSQIAARASASANLKISTIGWKELW